MSMWEEKSKSEVDLNPSIE